MMALHYRHCVVEQGTDLNLPQGPSIVAGYQVFDILDQQSAVYSTTGDAHVKKRIYQALHVPTGDSLQHFHQLLLGPLIYRTHHAEVDKSNAPITFNENVSRMGVGMEKSVFKDHLEKNLSGKNRREESSAKEQEKGNPPDPRRWASPMRPWFNP